MRSRESSVEPMSNCSSASGGWVGADAAAVMQAVESETLILYHTDLRGEWPRDAARALAARLPYGKRLATSADSPGARASLAGIALALRALSALTGRAVRPGEIVFAQGAKPRLAHACPDFSISHSGPWVGCAAVRSGRVGFDVEMGSGERIASLVAREAALKACGAGIRALREVRLSAGRASCRGELLHAHALQLFPGAAACVMTSLAVPELGAHALSPAELFAP
jgi:phosphopantetheinyl transferase